ncbi:MAG: penicillin-binding protein 2 [Patescibacteria group bacterium]|jgi:cell division protein FtsI/penicillin-binding protein 2|nr:penicillin-binding protein 2 [Patescibacteria group bacterium]
MWEGKNKNRVKKKKSKLGLGRWRIVVAIVFLFCFSIIYQLFTLQVKDCDLYKAKASRQHEYSSMLTPDRGRIYFQEKKNNQENFFAAATNRDMATIYTVPKDVLNPEEMAHKFYNFFDKPRLEEEIREENKEREIKKEVIIATSTKETIISNYLKRFDKPGDVYEPLNIRIEINNFLKLYSYIIQPEYEVEGEIKESSLVEHFNNQEYEKYELDIKKEITVDDLKYRNGKVYYTGEQKEEDTTLIIPGIGFNVGSYRYYPENELGSQLLGFVSYVDGEGKGRYGLEEFFNTELFGEYGSIETDVGAGNIMIASDRDYIEAKDGADIVLTIDRNIQTFACDKLSKAVEKHEATGGSVIIIDPKTGAILTMCSEPKFNPNNYSEVEDISVYNNPNVLYQYEPGSVFKVITMAAAIDKNKVKPSTTYNDEGQIMIEGWYKPIKNADFSSKGAHGIVDMNYVLDYSLNTGAIFAMKQTGVEDFSAYVKDFGFGEKTGVELGSEGSGNMANLLRDRVKEIDAATASFGQGIAVTPLQMVMSYQAIANEGNLMKPYIVDKIVYEDREEITNPKEVRQVISKETAETMLAMLVNIVEKGHSTKAKVDGYYVGGKTGTAQIASKGGYRQNEYVHTFIGVAPIEEPRFVMLTKIDSPKDVQYAESSVVPLFQDIGEFILKYYQSPKTR